MKTTVISKYKAPVGWETNPLYVYIGRGSKWGNPFSHLSDSKAEYICGSREESIELYKRWFENHPSFDGMFDRFGKPFRKPPVAGDLKELKGKVLVCFCHPKSCHGDYLALRANVMDAMCVLCGRNPVDVLDGYDTCQECLDSR